MSSLPRPGSFKSFRSLPNLPPHAISSRLTRFTHHWPSQYLYLPPDLKKVRFQDNPDLHHTYSPEEYCRQSPARSSLLPTQAAEIRRELNEFKRYEMEVHEQSQIFTHYYR